MARPLHANDFAQLFAPPAEEEEDDDDMAPNSRYYVVATARTAPEVFADGQNGPESPSLFAAAPLSFAHLGKLFERMPRVLRALELELAEAEEEDDAGADRKLFPQRAGEALAAYKSRLLAEAWPEVWERTARAAFSTSKGFDRAARNCRVSGRGPFRWDVRRLGYEAKEGHARPGYRLTHGQAIVRLHNLYNFVLRKLPSALRYSLIPMSRPHNGVDPLEAAGKYGWASLPLEDFSKARLREPQWTFERVVPAPAVSLKRSFEFLWRGAPPAPRLLALPAAAAGGMPGGMPAPAAAVPAAAGGVALMQAALMALYAPLGGGAEPQLPAAQALRLRQLLNKLPHEPVDAQGRARFTPTETRAVRGGAQFESVNGHWDVRLPNGGLLSQQAPALWTDLVQAKALYSRIVQRVQAGAAAASLTPTRLAALQALAPHWRAPNDLDQALRGLMLSYNVVLVPREECIRLLYAPASAAAKRAMREQLMDACRSFEELQAHRAWLAADMPAATPVHQRGFNRLMTPDAAKDFFKPINRQYYELSQVALYLPPVGVPVVCGFCTLDNFLPKERQLGVSAGALPVAGPGALPGASAHDKLPYFSQPTVQALVAESGGAGLARVLSDSAVEVNMVGFNHEPVVGTQLGRGMGMLLLLHSLLSVAGKRYAALTMFPIWAAPADTEGFCDMDRLREPAANGRVPSGQAPDVPVLQAYHEVLGAQRGFFMDGHLNAAAHASEAAARAAYVQSMSPDLHGASAAKKARIQRALESFQLRSPPPWSMEYAPLPAFPAPNVGALSEVQARALVQALAPYALSGNFAPSSDDKVFVGKNIRAMSIATPAARARVQAWAHELRQLLADHKALDSRLHEYRLARGFPQPEDVCGSLLLLRLQSPELFAVAGPRAQPLMGGASDDADEVNESSARSTASTASSSSQTSKLSLASFRRSPLAANPSARERRLAEAVEVVAVPEFTLPQLYSPQDMKRARKEEHTLEVSLPPLQFGGGAMELDAPAQGPEEHPGAELVGGTTGEALEQFSTLTALENFADSV